MIEIQLHKALQGATGPFALDLGLTIPTGELWAIMGPSGAGKTSFLRMLAGLMRPEKGEVVISGEKWVDTANRLFLKPQKRKVGFLFQDYALFPHWTVAQNLRFALGKGADQGQIGEWLTTFGLEGLAEQKPNRLSGGQLQRIALIRALIAQPDLLLLDEPLSALDAPLRKRWQDDLKLWHNRYPLTTLLISHDPVEVIRLADQMIWLEAGQIRWQGKPADYFGSERNQIQAEVLELDQTGQKARLLIGDQVLWVSLQPGWKVGDRVYLPAF